MSKSDQGKKKDSPVINVDILDLEMKNHLPNWLSPEAKDDASRDRIRKTNRAKYLAGRDGTKKTTT